MKDQKLTKRNWMAIGTIGLILVLGIIGRSFHQNWAQNIYLFISLVVASIMIYSATVKTKFRPHKEFIYVLCMHVFFCVGAGWWWISGLWIITAICWGTCMHSYIELHTAQEKSNETS